MFELVDACFDFIECFGAVGVEGELVDDFSRVDAFVNKMYGDAEHFDAVVIGVGDAVRAGERWQQGGVQVDDLHRVVRQQHFADVAHVACQDDVVDTALAQFLHNGCLVCRFVRILFGIEGEGVDVVFVGTFHGLAAGLV